ncbi:MAG TPA: 4Fe-4S binding protein [Candidatus Deferrimicrobium sp.]|nr:4Fe-4S binding protein [Candidatus Deferrimicrobium sp.]
MSNNEDIEKYYNILASKLDSTLQGLSPIGTQGNISKTWMDYLHTLVDPSDVKFLIQLPVFPATLTIKQFAKKINASEEEAEPILERLFRRDSVMRVGSTKKHYAIHLPFLIFDVPPLSYDEMPPEKAKKLAELSYKYLVDEDWYKNFEGSPSTPLSRIIPVQESIPVQQEILPYEKVVEIVKTAKTLSLQKCACRTRLDYLGIRKCDHPLESCIGVNQGAQYFIDRGHAREITKEEALRLLKEYNKRGLVHTTENFREGNHTLICNCCSCCCNLIGGITRWENPRAVAKSNFVAEVANPDDCSQCGICVEKCNFQAITLEHAAPTINIEQCMGCGVCVVNCPADVLKLNRSDREVIYKDLIELGLKVAKETNREIKF